MGQRLLSEIVVGIDSSSRCSVVVGVYVVVVVGVGVVVGVV